MSVLNAFVSTWTNARSTFGQGAPQTGEAYDASATLRQMQSDLGSAAPGSRWTGSAASAYDTANTEHRRVIGELAGLDQRLKAQIDQSSQVVSIGRGNLDAVRKWVLDAAAAVPQSAAAERMLVPIVHKGIGDVIDIVQRSNGELNAIGANIRRLGEEYRALGDQNFGNGPRFIGGDEGKGPGNEYEKALREAGLLTGPPPEGYYKEWLDNAKRQGVASEVIVDIARRHNIAPESFDVLNGMEKITDKDGKSFFLIPPGTSGHDAKKAVLMTYVLNAGTDYGDNPQHDFAETTYSADEVQRIIDRQNANSWSYDQDVDFVHSHGGRLVTTPNGMLMGLGGDWVQDKFSLQGGTAWGDIFMMNIDNPADSAQMLRAVVGSGHKWGVDDGVPFETSLDMDRLLHHEERHSQQWAERGYLPFISAYLAGKPTEWMTGVHPFERDAGLSDGGYG